MQVSNVSSATERVLDPDGSLVTVRATAPRPAAALELCGELPCWQHPIAMQRAGTGWEARVRLAPGIYEAKLREPGGPWFVDAAWRTIDRDGERNGAIVVGGTDEPVLHAPAAPWLAITDDGRVIVRAALRRGHGDRLVLRADDGAGPTLGPMAVHETRRAMRVAGGDASHLWFEVELAGASRAIEYGFELADRRTIAGPTGAFRVATRELHAPLPAWWRDAAVYTIFVDRFRRGSARWADASRWDRDARAGGDLAGVIEALPYLADLGVTVLHLTPICVAGSLHRYDAIDPVAVDPELGGDAALDALLEAAHARDLRLVLDVATTHVHREYAPFRDVAARGPASPYWRWFHAQRWPFAPGVDPGYAHYQNGQWQEPLLAVDEPEVQDEIAGWFTAWARRGADGLRVDAAADLPPALLARIRGAVRAVNPEAIVFGEVVPACVQRFAPTAVDAATDFAYREALVGWLSGSRTFADAAALQRWRGAAGPHAIGFTGTHDQPRIATVTQDAALARLGLVAVALGARVPMLYYGDEVGLHAGPDAAARAFEDAWPDRRPMPWDAAAWDRDTHTAVRAALALRRAHELLRRGDETVYAVSARSTATRGERRKRDVTPARGLHAAGDGETVLVRRHRLDDAIDIVLHRGATACEVELPAGPATLLLVVGTATLDPTRTRLQLGARSLAVVDRREPPSRELRVANPAIAAEAFARRTPECPAYPRRLYLTVTEACNLRCAHCITDAPARTQAGRARTVQPWLLDALAEPFAHAEYVAFTHGGESLTAPIFPEVLRRIRAARGDLATDVHLVTNGMLLDADRVAELVELGVTSLMVSLDGATAATNDRIRVLGRFDRVVANVAAAVQLRAQRGLDLRIGISTVAGAANARELPALGRLCLELGVDWLKIEETYPATAFARRDLLAPAELAHAMAALRDVLAGRGLVLVDHLDPPAACSCTGDPAAVAFRAADDFANRFRYCACRVAWEQAAIDPDGTVHVGDYGGAPLGSLLDAPLLALWNSPAALAARR